MTHRSRGPAGALALASLAGGLLSGGRAADARGGMLGPEASAHPHDVALVERAKKQAPELAVLAHRVTQTLAQQRASVHAARTYGRLPLTDKEWAAVLLVCLARGYAVR